MSLLTNVLKLWRTGQYLLPADSGFMVKHLFANGEPGFAKLDFSGFAGMYQDRARTIPYTAVEQPLGSFTGLNGVTATAPADVNRGVVSARVNLLNKTGAGAVWNSATKTEIPNYFGSDVGFSLYQDGVGFGDSPNLNSSMSLPAGQKLTSSAIIDMATVWPGSSVKVWVFGFHVGGGVGYAQAALSSTGVVSIGVSAATTEIEVSKTLLYGSVYQISVSARFTAALTGSRLYCEAVNLKTSVWGRPQLTYYTDSNLPYQYVNTATDYDTAGFPHYLAFNGTNTSYVTPSIDFTGTDKMTVWAGVTKLSDAVTAMLAELSTGLAGSFFIKAPQGAAATYSMRSGGSILIEAVSPANYAAPITSVLTGIGDISGDSVILRVNGSQVAANVLDQGTGNYVNYPFYIGARAGTSQYFNGRLYSLIVRGAATPLPQIEATENLIRKTMRLP